MKNMYFFAATHDGVLSQETLDRRTYEFGGILVPIPVRYHDHIGCEEFFILVED